MKLMAVGMVGLVACVAVGCNRSGSAELSSAAVVPADAKTIDAFKKEFPSFSAAGKGKTVKIHGYVQATGSDLVPISDSVDKTVPFAFCKVTKKPTSLKTKAHVVAEGTLDDRGDIESCKLTVL